MSDRAIRAREPAVSGPDPDYVPRSGDLAELWSPTGCVDAFIDRDAFIVYWAERFAAETYGSSDAMPGLLRKLRDEGRSVAINAPAMVKVEAIDCWKGGAAEVTFSGTDGASLRTLVVPAECVVRRKPTTTVA